MPETAAKHPLVDILTVNFTVNCKGVTTGHRCCGTCPGTVWSIPDVSCRATACPGRLLVDKLWVEESEWVDKLGGGKCPYLLGRDMVSGVSGCQVSLVSLTE